MTGLGIACLSIVAIGFAALAIRLARIIGPVKLKTGRQRLRGFSVFDLQLTVASGKGPEPPKTEAALYFTVKTLPAEPMSSAKMLFAEKVRRLGE